MGNQVSGLKALKAEHVDLNFWLILFAQPGLVRIGHWLAAGHDSFDPFHRGAHVAHVPAHDSQSLWGITENDMKSLFALLLVVWKLEGSTSLTDLGKVSYLKM
jgi:hypothetical protein